MAKKKVLNKIALVAVILMLIAAIVACSVAWFINYSTNKVDGYNVSVKLGNIVQCSLDGQNYSNTLNINFANTTEYPNLKMVDITGDGASFLRPALSQEENSASPNVDAQWTEPVANRDYISFKLYFRSSSPLDIYLGQDSFVLPRSSSTEINKSNYGEFTRDGIAGATRVGFLDSNDNLLFTWAPNPKYQLSYSEEDGWEMNYDGVPEDKYTYYDSNKNLQTFQPDSIITTPNVTLDQDVPTGAKKLVTLTENTADKYYYGQIKVNIWVEGCDRESRRALEGGVFNTELQFVALSAAQ